MINFDRVTFLLGSGISIPSGMPSVEDITDALHEKDHLRERDQRGLPIPIDHPGSPINSYFLREATDGILTLLKAHCDQHFVVRGLGRSNYEDIYYLGKQVLDFVEKEYDNPGLMSYFTELKEKLTMLEGSLNAKYSRFPPEIEKPTQHGLGFYLQRCLDQIEGTVATKLATPKKIKGLKLLEAILESNEQNKLHLVTLNHDLLTETYLGRFGVNDGFRPLSKNLAQFCPDSFENENSTRVSILKPHGSINWYRYKDNLGSEMFCKLLSGEAAYARYEKGERIDANPKRLLLAGTTNKEISYGSGIFLEILHQLHSRLKRTVTLVSSGYGFRDKGINNRIWAWLESHDSNRLIVMHDKEQQDELFLNAKGSFKNNYDRLEKLGKITFIDKWMCNTQLEELISVIDKDIKEDPA